MSSAPRRFCRLPGTLAPVPPRLTILDKRYLPDTQRMCTPGEYNKRLRPIRLRARRDVACVSGLHICTSTPFEFTIRAPLWYGGPYQAYRQARTVGSKVIIAWMGTQSASSQD